jgi:hypothetical protein
MHPFSLHKFNVANWSNVLDDCFRWKLRPSIGCEIIFTFIVGGKPSFTLSLCDFIIIIISIILKLKNHLQ